MSKLNSGQQQKCRQLFAKAIITGLVPFEFAENKYLKQLFQILRPDFKHPSSQTISSSYLPLIKTETKTKVEQKLKEHKSSTLDIDGAEDNNGNPINHILALTPKPFLLRTVRPNGQSQTGEALVAQTEEPHQYLEKITCISVCFSDR